MTTAIQARDGTMTSLAECDEIFWNIMLGLGVSPVSSSALSVAMMHCKIFFLSAQATAKTVSRKNYSTDTIRPYFFLRLAKSAETLTAHCAMSLNEFSTDYAESPFRAIMIACAFAFFQSVVTISTGYVIRKRIGLSASYAESGLFSLLSKSLACIACVRKTLMTLCSFGGRFVIAENAGAFRHVFTSDTIMSQSMGLVNPT